MARVPRGLETGMQGEGSGIRRSVADLPTIALPTAREMLATARRQRDEAAATYRDAQADLLALSDALKDARERADEQFDRTVRSARLAYMAVTDQAWRRYVGMKDNHR